MNILRNVIDESPELKRLINRLYEVPEVQGFALGVHENYVSMFRGEYGPDFDVNQILESTQRPHGWIVLCHEAGFPSELSPIYLAVYVDTDKCEFRYQFDIPRVVGPENYGVFVEETGRFRATQGRGRHRPVRGGISIGSTSSPHSSGTLGGFIKNESNDETFLVTCHHVLSTPGSPVVQQGIPDGGRNPGDVVGSTAHVVPLHPYTQYNLAAPYNKSDVAAAKIDIGIATTPHLRVLDTPVSDKVAMSMLAIGDEVAFVGKESDCQEAYVHAFIARIKVTMNGIERSFGDVFEIRPRRRLYVGSLSRPGDSGSWVVLRTSVPNKQLCGMLFADNGRQASLCSFADTFLDDLAKQANTQFKLA